MQALDVAAAVGPAPGQQPFEPEGLPARLELPSKTASSPVRKLLQFTPAKRGLDLDGGEQSDDEAGVLPGVDGILQHLVTRKKALRRASVASGGSSDAATERCRGLHAGCLIQFACLWSGRGLFPSMVCAAALCQVAETPCIASGTVPGWVPASLVLSSCG